MRYLLTPVGSSGDVHPYVGLGRELSDRGHEVILFAAEPHRSVVERAGIEFVSVATEEQYHAATRDPDLWHPRRGFETVLRLVVAGLEPTWTALESWHEPGAVLVAHPLAFAARSFEEKTGIGAVTLHLAPSSLRTAYQVPALPPALDISGWPMWLKRSLWYLVDRFAIDPLITPALDAWRASHGLGPVRRIFQDWINSPQGVIGLFPEWYGPRQPDWPKTFAFAGFPLWDDPQSAAGDDGLEAFLASGPPPVVVSPGSANRHAGPFFAAAAEAITRLGRRGLFLTGFPEQLPAGLPETILHRPYAPFSAVLPRSAALVHHGGIGTLAQGCAAGVPQLIMPMGFDQPDNALRATRMGVARWLVPARFTGRNVERVLAELLQSRETARAVAACRERTRGEQGIPRAVDLIERMTAEVRSR